jgi:hypothetical protein
LQLFFEFYDSLRKIFWKWPKTFWREKPTLSESERSILAGCCQILPSFQIMLPIIFVQSQTLLSLIKVFRKICKLLQYQIKVIWIIMKYTSILYTFDIVHVGDFVIYMVKACKVWISQKIIRNTFWDEGNSSVPNKLVLLIGCWFRCLSHMIKWGWWNNIISLVNNGRFFFWTDNCCFQATVSHNVPTQWHGRCWGRGSSDVLQGAVEVVDILRPMSSGSTCQRANVIIGYVRGSQSRCWGFTISNASFVYKTVSKALAPSSWHGTTSPFLCWRKYDELGILILSRTSSPLTTLFGKQAHY